MAVKRIVANVAAKKIDAAKAFYGDALGMTVAMDLGWIVTFASDASMVPQISVATARAEADQADLASRLFLGTQKGHRPDHVAHHLIVRDAACRPLQGG